VKVQGSEPDQIWILATNARELPAELIKVAYQYRWQVEVCHADCISSAGLYRLAG
jgi:hypothetical protein